ncbi:MAG TPA: hypothetical protein VLC94_04100 [Candidatus Acidoferrum sp.]|nr:hypothetical protein [Candidatus Acidoferrum sp.]
MKNDYLWDGTGEADPELQKLEAALGQFRARAEAPALVLENARDAKRILAGWRMPRWIAASLLAAGLAATAVVVSLRVAPVAAGPGWNVARLEGTPVVGAATVDDEKQKAKLRVGEELVTDGTSRASIQVAEIGELYVDPGSRVRLVESGANRKRIAVEVGTIHAAIWAPPGEFVVDTPSATAVDLGCAYTLTVEEDGSGSLRTTLGWVGFHDKGHDSFIPAGAMCLTRPKEGTGTPYFEDAPQEFREALHALDFGTVSGTERERSLRLVLSQARTRDAFTLWHLLNRVDARERALVYERLAKLVQAPSGTTREGTLRLDAKMMDAWWNAFGLGDIGIWRFWEQNEAPRERKAAS